MTLAAFLAWEERQERKYEFDGFAPVAMTGGTQGHNGIALTLTRMLRARLRGKPCRPYGSNRKVEVTGSVRYLDAVVVCREYPRGTTVRPGTVSNRTFSADRRRHGLGRTYEWRPYSGSKRWRINRLRPKCARPIVIERRVPKDRTENG